MESLDTVKNKYLYNTIQMGKSKASAIW
jgi:hypothetical protein